MADMLQRSRGVADNADYLNIARLSGSPSQLEDALDDLAAAYDRYADEADVYSSRFGFDEISTLSSAEDRDQLAANAMASALIDLEMAVVLGRAAQVAGEIEGEATAEDIDAAVVMLNQTIRAVGDLPDEPSSHVRFAFDEVTALSGPESMSSPDVATAKATFERQVQAFYEGLLSETTALLVDSFQKLSKLDFNKTEESLQALSASLEKLPGGRFVPRALGALKRAVTSLKGVLGPALTERIEEWFDKVLRSLREGKDALHVALKFLYGYDTGREKIAAWLESSTADRSAIDNGTKQLAALQEQMVQTFALQKRIAAALHLLSGPIEWMLKKVGGTLPLDLVMAGAFVLVVDVGLVRGRDYADASGLVQFVDGVLVLSARALRVGNAHVVQ